MLKSYKELKVWQKAYDVCLLVYKTTGAFPSDERYGLTAQARRSAVSVPSNIAEGYGRKTTADYVRMLYIALGSLCELETQIMLSEDLSYRKKDRVTDLKNSISEVERMLKALIRSLEEKHLAP